MKSFLQQQSSSSASLVQSNSVQLQFAALSRDRDEFRNAMEDAERERRLTETQVQNLKSTQTSLMRDTIAAQEELGGLTRTLTMLRQEQSRLTRVFENERKALENCSRHTTALVQQEIKRKEEYNAQMGPLNDDMNNILEQEAGYDFQKFLSVQSVQAAIMAKPLPPVSPEDIEVNVEAIKEGFALLQEAECSAEHEIKKYQSRKTRLDQLRARARQNAQSQPPHHNDNNESMDLEVQEQLWGGGREGGVEDGDYDTRTIFDGMDDGMTEHDPQHHHHHHHHDAADPQQQHHMDLFYGPQHQD